MTPPVRPPVNLLTVHSSSPPHVRQSERKATPSKAAELAALKNPFGAVPSGRNGKQASVSAMFPLSILTLGRHSDEQRNADTLSVLVIRPILARWVISYA